MFDISNINLERVFIFQRYIIAILILLPALIIGYLMLEFNKLFTQKIAPIIRLLYIVSLSFMTAIFEANKFPVEYINYYSWLFRSNWIGYHFNKKI